MLPSAKSATTADTKNGYRPDIDGLRAVAVLAVLAFHANPTAVRGGFVGVDIFFVISGFLISGIIFSELNSGAFTLANFYKRRIRRIFPALIVVLAFCLIVGWFVLLLDGFASLGKHVLASVLFFQNVTLWLESGYFDRDSALKPLLHLWSLGIEEQYYLIWPLALAAIWGRRALLVWTTVAVTVASFIFNVITIRHDPSVSFYLLPSRAWELLLGALVAYLHFSWQQSPSKAPFLRSIHENDLAQEILATAGAVLVFVSIFALNGNLLFPGWWALAPTVGTALIIFSGPQTTLSRRILSNRALVFVGLISYPLYLWHWPLLSFLKIAEGYPSRAAQVIAVLAAFPLAWATYTFVEKPIRFGKTRKNFTYYPAYLAAAMIVVGLAGVLTFATGGVPSRFPDALVHILKEPYDVTAAYRYKKCFLETATQDYAAFGSECSERRPGNVSVLLWGDSHAAHLYPGLRQLQKEVPFGLSQFNGCSPIIDTHARQRPDDKCARISQFVRDYIVREKPEVVLLSARWSNHRIPLSEGLAETVSFLKSSGVKKIVVFGPPPIWKPDLKGAVARRFIASGDITQRMTTGLDGFAATQKVDKSLQEITAHLGVEYLSALDRLCDGSGCLVKVDDAPDGLISSDRDHYSEKGSIYFIGLLKNLLSSSFRSAAAKSH
jgi:peptidoglycan/LPS O-acetylase OafA/YrhL